MTARYEVCFHGIPIDEDCPSCRRATTTPDEDRSLTYEALLFDWLKAGRLIVGGEEIDYEYVSELCSRTYGYLNPRNELPEGATGDPAEGRSEAHHSPFMGSGAVNEGGGAPSGLHPVYGRVRP